jgi:uncharacterized membrane protein YhaH (DUF805 family)
MANSKGVFEHLGADAQALVRRAWWVFLVGGIAMVAFGALAFLNAGVALFVLAMFFAASVLVDGVSNVVGSIQNRDKDGWWIMLLIGLLVVAISAPISALLGFAIPVIDTLLIVLGAGPLRPGDSARNVPVNITLVREGSGEFFATQGDDKCAFDVLRQTPVAGSTKSFRVEGRGYCTQPARAVGGGPAVLVSRCDVTAIVDEFDDADDTAPAAPP